jgi:cobalt/nickel transport system ATP-binding protein
MSHHIVEFQDVHYQYPDGTNALNGLSLRITHGESVGIIGANGSGKSTLIRALSRVISPHRGHILVDGRDLAAIPRVELARLVESRAREAGARASGAPES